MAIEATSANDVSEQCERSTSTPNSSHLRTTRLPSSVSPGGPRNAENGPSRAGCASPLCTKWVSVK